MADKKLTVTTDAGTFTRRTARTYTHIVVVKGYRHELLEGYRLGGIARAKKEVANYERVLGTPDGIAKERARQGWSDFYTTDWVIEARGHSVAEIAKLEAQGPITADKGDAFEVHGWCGRLDLAVKLAATERATNHREVRIYALDGTRVR